MLATAHGIALQPLADDLNAELSADKVVVTRPGGLSLSSSARAGAPPPQRHVLDLQSWGFDRTAEFGERRSKLMSAAADAPEPKAVEPSEVPVERAQEPARPDVKQRAIAILGPRHVRA